MKPMPWQYNHMNSSQDNNASNNYFSFRFTQDIGRTINLTLSIKLSTVCNWITTAAVCNKCRGFTLLERDDAAAFCMKKKLKKKLTK